MDKPSASTEDGAHRLLWSVNSAAMQNRVDDHSPLIDWFGPRGAFASPGIAGNREDMNFSAPLGGIPARDSDARNLEHLAGTAIVPLVDREPHFIYADMFVSHIHC